MTTLQTSWDDTPRSIVADIEALKNRILNPPDRREDDAAEFAAHKWLNDRFIEWDAAGKDNSIWGTTAAEMVSNLRESLRQAISSEIEKIETR